MLKISRNDLHMNSQSFFVMSGILDYEQKIICLKNNSSIDKFEKVVNPNKWI